MRELLRLKKYLLRYKFHYLIGIIALIIIDLLQLLIPRVLKAAIDGLATGIADFSKLGVYFIIIILIAIGIAIGRFFWRYLLIGSSRKIERLLRTDFYSHLVTLDFTYFDVHKTGDLMAHAVNDINAVRMALGFGFIILVDVVILGIASLVMMVNISPRLTMYALIPFPLIAIFSTRFAGLIHHLFEKVQEAFAFLTERVRENLAGIRIVKLFVQEGGEIKKFQDLSQEYVEKNKRLIKIWGMFFPLIILLGMIGQVIVIWLGGRYVILGQISIGSFVAFIAYLQILVWPMMAIGWTINLFQRGSASQRRLNRIFNVQPDIKDGTVETELSGAIEFKDVSFIYQGKDIPALSQISFNIEPREFLGITGPVASGKTSLVNLILRFYEPTEGQILLDGYDIKELKQKSIRQNIAYVPQDTFLFSDTIRNNILLGKSDASEGDLKNAARIAQIYDEIMRFPNGFDTIIGERGVTLSGGQKQRVALARALLLNRPILILDDAASSVDAETELRIFESLRNDIKRRTAIVISHRVFALQEADRIIVLDNGRISEVGRHDELIKAGGLYSEIYQRQQIEMRLDRI